MPADLTRDVELGSVGSEEPEQLAAIRMDGPFRVAALEREYRSAIVQPALARQLPRVFVVMLLGFVVALLREAATRGVLTRRGVLALVGCTVSTLALAAALCHRVACVRTHADAVPRVWPHRAFQYGATAILTVQAGLITQLEIDEATLNYSASYDRIPECVTGSIGLQLLTLLVLVNGFAPAMQPVPYAVLCACMVALVGVGLHNVGPEGLVLREFGILCAGVSLLVAGRWSSCRASRAEFDLRRTLRAAHEHERALEAAEAAARTASLTATAASDARSKLIRVVRAAATRRACAPCAARPLPARPSMRTVQAHTRADHLRPAAVALAQRR